MTPKLFVTVTSWDFKNGSLKFFENFQIEDVSTPASKNIL